MFLVSHQIEFFFFLVNTLKSLSKSKKNKKTFFNMLLVLPLYLSSGRCSLTLVCPKVWSAIPDSVKSSAHLYLEMAT